MSAKDLAKKATMHTNTTKNRKALERKPIKQLERRAEYLNNQHGIAIVPALNKEREIKLKTTEECKSSRSIMHHEITEEKQKECENKECKMQEQKIDEFEVRIWLPATSVATRVEAESVAGSKSWLRVSGSGCRSTRVQVTTVDQRRPNSAPPTVKKLSLTPRPTLRKYQFLQRSSGNRQAKIKKSLTPSVVKVEIPKPHEADTKKKLAPKASKGSRVMPISRAEERKRKAEAKRRAETEFRNLLQLNGMDIGDSLKFPPYVLPSRFSELPDTVCFKGLPSEKAEQGLESLNGKKLFVYYSGSASTPVRLAFLKAGFRVSKSPTIWNILWGPAPNAKNFQLMSQFHRVNHFPGSSELGRKDKLYRNIQRLKLCHQEEFNFMPSCFIVPEQRDELRQELAKHKDRRYIIKPVASSCGRGIRITNSPSNFSCAKAYIVQRYIRNPMTINGLKFDLRVYAGVTSYEPLRVYVYEDGLVRFATESYSTGKDKMDNRFIHITNTSVNRQRENYVKNQDANKADVGSKWSIKAFRTYITKHRIANWSHIWTQIREIVAKTFIAVSPRMKIHMNENNVAFSNSCFEVLGFDILLDTTQRAWLLEVNTFPDLSGSSPLDHKVKTELVEDMLHMIGINPEGSCRRKAVRTNRNEESKVTACNCESKYIIQTLDEISRRCGWESVIPETRDPFRYKLLFELLSEKDSQTWEAVKLSYATSI